MLAVPVGESRLPHAHPGWWLIRFHWQPEEGYGHPEYTFAERCSESEALGVAMDMAGREYGCSLSLIEVHVKESGKDRWTLVA